MPLLLPLGLAALPAQGMPACRAAQLSLGADAQGGAFDGMSHSGTLLVVRNRGPHACALPGLPTLSFEGAGGKTLPITRAAPRFMHPGPVVPPVGIPPGATVASPLRWVSGAVYNRSRCYAVRAVSLRVSGKPVRAPLAAHICGPSSGVTVEQSVLQAGQPHEG